MDPASYVTTGSHDTFEEMVRIHGSSPTPSSPLCTLFGDALGLPQGAYLDFPRPREWRAAAGHYRDIFAAYGIHPQDTVLRLPNRRIYILPHVQEFRDGLDSTWEDRLTRWTLGVRNALKEGEALPPFPMTAWTVGFQNGFEARNELPPSPTVAEVKSEGTDPPLESDSLGAGVTKPEGAAPASEGDSRVRGQAEPGGAAYVAVKNTLMAEKGDITVAGPLPLPLSQPSATPAAVRCTAEGTGPARESDPSAAGVAPPEGATLASEGDPGREQTDPGGAVSVTTGNSRTAENREAMAPGHSRALPTQPSVTPATSRATASISTGEAEGGRSTRGRRDRPRGSGRGTRATSWERRHHEPGANPSTWKRRGSLGPCRRKGWRWREGTRGRRGRRVSTRERNATSRFHCRRPQRYDLWGL